MATTAHRAMQNVRWRLNALALTAAYGSPSFMLRPFDPTMDEPDNTSGWVRRYFARWVGSREDTASTNLEGREAIHVVELHVLYPTAALPWEDLESLVLQDRHDIEKEMRDQAKRTGYDDSNTTAATGIYLRHRGAPDMLQAGGSLIPGYADLPANIMQLFIELHMKIREEET